MAAHRLTLFEEYLRTHPFAYTTFHPHYNDALNQMLGCGGKRFRPMLMLAVVEALAAMTLPGALPVALAVEMLHTYSLIHDDLPAMDNADMRRGTLTLHVTYDEVTAILAGDALNTYAFELVAEAPLSADVRIALVGELARAGGAGGMVLGQALDCHFSLSESRILTLDQLRMLHGLKTGRLIAASLTMGAIIAQADKALRERLEHFGMKMGLAFQIRDDLIDMTATSDVAGKTTGRDGDKFSFVTMLGLDGAHGEFGRLADEIRVELAQFPSELEKNLLDTIETYLTVESC